MTIKVMRVFHGGVVRRFQRRDEELMKLGADLVLVVPPAYDELPQRTYANPNESLVPIIVARGVGPKRNPWFTYSPIAIFKTISTGNFDIIDLHEEPYSLAALSVLIARWFQKRKPVLVFRSSQNVYKRYPAPFAQIQRWCLTAASAAYVPSRQAKDVLHQKGFTKPVSVVGNGVELEVIQHSIPRGDNLPIIYAGRWTERKGVLDLVEAVIAQPRATLTVVGSGPLDTQLRMLAADCSRIRMIPTVDQDELRDLFREHVVVACPSRVLPGWSEQFSRSVVEGMANYCVPLVSSSGALVEVTGDIGPSFQAGNVAALSESLAYLEGLTPADFADLRERAHAHAMRYSFEQTSKEIFAIYTSCLGR